jgi:CheY-like chemotaxis protein
MISDRTAGRPHSTPPVVLIVEDDADSREMYSVALFAMGFRPVAAANADEAFASACEHQPEAIVADVSLPGASGVDLTRWLRADTRTRDARILVLSGHAYGGVEQAATDAGCDRFLLKPCLPDTLAHEIEGLLDSRGQASQGGKWDGRSRDRATDGNTERCPQCRGSLSFSTHHPILTVGTGLERPGAEVTSRMRYERGWVCRNPACDFRVFEEKT